MATFRNLRERVETLPSRNPRISQAFFFKEIPSTNLDSLSRGKLGAPAGTLIVADSQSQGRGRLDRHWESPLGKGLYFTLLLRPKLAPPQAPLLTLAAGLGIARVLKEMGVPSVTVKWPNDILVDRKKLGGILTEMVTKKDRVDFVVVGVGLNILTEAGEFTPETAAIAVSLKQVQDKPWDRGEILENVVGALLQEAQELEQKGPAHLVSRWEKESGLVGERIRAQTDGETMEGKVLGLAADGQLRIQTERGEIVELLAGDTRLL